MPQSVKYRETSPIYLQKESNSGDICNGKYNLFVHD